MDLPKVRIMDPKQMGSVRKDIRGRVLTLAEIMATETQYVRQLGTIVAVSITVLPFPLLRPL